MVLVRTLDEQATALHMPPGMRHALYNQAHDAIS